MAKADRLEIPESTIAKFMNEREVETKENVSFMIDPSIGILIEILF